MKKRGELTTQQIVVLIVLIASFAILLFFIFKLNLGSETDKELCRNSVIMRSAPGLPTESIPLKCHREYVCITADGSCEKMTNPNIEEVETPEEVYEVLAEKLADCWWMFGEGKVNYVGSDLFEELYCSLCAQIAFDDSVRKDVFKMASTFDRGDFYKYLEKEEVKKDMTYSQYLKTEEFSTIYQGSPIYLDKQYYVLTALRSEQSYAGWIAGGALVGAGIAWIVGTGGVGAIALGTFMTIGASGGGYGGYAFASVIDGESGNKYINPSLVEVNSQEFKSLKCESISTLS